MFLVGVVFETTRIVNRLAHMYISGRRGTFEGNALLLRPYRCRNAYDDRPLDE